MRYDVAVKVKDQHLLDGSRQSCYFSEHMIQSRYGAVLALAMAAFTQ
jgi:hypothetical protein